VYRPYPYFLIYLSPAASLETHHVLPFFFNIVMLSMQDSN
jgi:hypothetical protein